MIRNVLLRYRQFFIFSIIGVANTVTHGAVLMFCVEIWSLAVVLSHLIAFGVANIISYVLNSIYTFHTKITFHRYTKFWAASMVSLGLTLILSWLINQHGFHYMAGFLIIVITVPIVSFVIMKFWAFSIE
jgi:putative flippase GtrA